MKAIKEQSQTRMRDTLNDPPGMRIGSDMRSPCKRLIADSEATTGRSLRELIQLACYNIIIAKGIALDVRTKLYRYRDQR